jgi:hypothetical protein
MKSRAAKFVVAAIASIVSSANLVAAPDSTEQPAETCLTSPREYTPPGTRWRYRMERGSGRRCWFLKDDAEKAASKASEQATAATEEPAAAPPAPPRKKSAAPHSVSDARAEFSRVTVEQDARPAPAQSAPAPAASAAVADSNQPSAAKSANMLAPAAATHWPDPMSRVNPAANPPAPPAPAASPADQNAEARPAPAPKPQVMPRAVPPMPASEKPMSWPMLITIIAGGLSVLAVLVSVLFAWLASRKAERTRAAMPPLDMPEKSRRPGDLYRERKRLHAKNRRRAA